MIHTWQITTQEARQLEFPKQKTLDEITRQLPDGFYSTFRTYGQGRRVIGLKAHLQRLYQPVQSADANEAALREQLRLLLRDYPNEARVRVIMSKQGQLYVVIEPRKPLPREIYENGVHVETIEMARHRPRLKSTAFISESQDEREHVARQGFFEALMVKNGKILEGMTSNFFYTVRPAKSPQGERSRWSSRSVFFRPYRDPAQSKREDVLCTAQRGILLGVTRRTVIRVARGRGLAVKYEPLKRDQLEVAREACITSSSRGIVPVVRIDEVTVGEGRPGPITRQLSAAYEAHVLEKAEEI